VHFDVWSPCPVTSIAIFCYFVTFVDHFSHTTWIFIIKSRQKNFVCSFVKTQFDTTIKILRSDNVKEYFINKLIQYMTDNGIIHESSYAYTSQQNGVVE
jgi:hypothetical protein